MVALRFIPVLAVWPLLACSGVAQITPEQAAPRDTALIAQAAATGATPRTQTLSTPLSLDRPVCGPDAPLSLQPTCRTLPPVRTQTVPSGPDSAAWYAQGRRDADRRNAMIENENQRIRLDNSDRPFDSLERSRLNRERLRLDMEQNRAPQQNMTVSPFGPTTGRYGL